MELTDEERGSLAVKLLDSISAPDDRTDAEWIVEIERRAAGATSPEAEHDSTVEQAVSRIERDLGL